MKRLSSRSVLAGLFLVFAAASACFNVSDVDVGYHIRTGEWIWQQKRLPTENTFSYTHEHHPWLLQQGPPTLAIYALDRLGGPTALVLAAMVLAVAIFGLVLTAGLRRGARAEWAVLFAIAGIMAARFRFNLRPDLLSGLFFAILAWHMAAVRMGASANLYLIVILLAVWANCHAGVVYGAVFLAAVCAGEFLNGLAAQAADAAGKPRPSRLFSPTFWRLLIALIGGVLVAVFTVAVLNPNGPGGLLLPFRFFMDRYYMSVIAEYARAAPAAQPWFFVLLAAALALAVAQRRKLDWSEAIPVLAFATLAAGAVRNILFFSILAAPAGAVWMTALLARGGAAEHASSAVRPLRIVALSGLMLALSLAFFLPDKVYPFGIGLHPTLYPEALFRIIRTEPVRGELFNEMRFGGPLLWRVGPARKVFIDGRLEAYDKSFWREVYDPVCAGQPLWPDVFKRYNINAALVGYRPGSDGMDIAHRLASDTNWALIGWAEQALLFARRVPAHEDLIRRRAITAIRPLAADLNYITPELTGSILTEAAALEADGQGFPGLWIVEGRTRLVGGDLLGAAEAYGKALFAESSSPLARRDLAFCLRQLGHTVEAARLERGLPREDPIPPRPREMP